MSNQKSEIKTVPEDCRVPNPSEEYKLWLGKVKKRDVYTRDYIKMCLARRIYEQQMFPLPDNVPIWLENIYTTDKNFEEILEEIRLDTGISFVKIIKELEYHLPGSGVAIRPYKTVYCSTNEPFAGVKLL